ncbi:MAG: fumarylacetoacetate hydrolase family protein [Sneathiellales bacterium]|nr:fumarylacetoacetate hydrolase family protein [Sneathiellales bacterium]
MSFLFPTPPVNSLPVKGSEKLFPVRRLYCVGRNYAEHTKEMGGDPEREAPFFFSKPSDAIVQNGSIVDYPQQTSNLHHEVELVIALDKGGRDLSLAEAENCIFGYAAGVDLTRRDLQNEAKKKGRPWDASKGFDQSAPCSALTPKELVPEILSAEILLKANSAIRQRAHISDMIWSPSEIVAHLSGLFNLVAGDLVFTGTPAGVGALLPGDQVSASVTGLDILDFTIR